jgi:hypothetical protein
VIPNDIVPPWIGAAILFSQELEEADDSLHYRMNAVIRFKMNPDNPKATLQGVWLDQGRADASVGNR